MLSPSPGCGKRCEDSDKPATERHFRNNQEGLRTDWLFDHMRRLSLTTYSVMMMTRLHWMGRVLTGERTGLGLPVEQPVGGVGLGEPAMQATWTQAIRALPLCASKHAHHVCFVKGGCQHSDRIKGKAGLCGVVTSLDVSELRGKRRTACLPASSGRSGGEHTSPGGHGLVQIFQEECLPLTAPRLPPPRLPPGVVRAFTLVFRQCGPWGPYKTLHGRRLGLSRVGVGRAVD